MNEKLKQLAASWAAYRDSKNGKYFMSSKRGETYELKVELNSDRSERKKEAIKKVIANMTVGKDVSGLFADVLKCMQTDDIELKKLIYLYLMNYAKSQPDLVILAVNTFCKDTEDPNPLIRALALRTMGCIRVGKIVDYICNPLKKALNDPNPYVRKTAAIAVAKLHDLAPSLAEDHGFINKLQELISDLNPSVVANAIAALSEIHEKSPNKSIFTVNSVNLSKLLSSLNDCTEWGQITILEAISFYTPTNEGEAEMIIDKVIPRLQHANASVIMGAVKVLILLLEIVKDNTVLKTQIYKKILPPFITVLSSSYPEIQFVSLTNLKLIMETHPDFYINNLKVFFCKYNDPLYVKLAKIDILILICNEGNMEEILCELNECTNELEVEFVTKSIKAIGHCALKIPTSASKATKMLLDLLKIKKVHVTSTCIVVFKDMLRKYGLQIPIKMSLLFEQLDSVTDVEAKASLIWILGEYCHLLETAPNLLKHFESSFLDEPLQIQYQILAAAVKLYIRMPSFVQDLVHSLLDKTACTSDNADLKDRAYIYWRLLSGDPKFTKLVVLENKSNFNPSDDVRHDIKYLKKLLYQISNISSIYFTIPSELETPKFEYKFEHELASPSKVLFEQQYPNLIETFSNKNSVENIIDLDFDGIVPVDESIIDLPFTNRTSKEVIQSLGDIDLLCDDIESFDKQSFHSVDADFQSNSPNYETPSIVVNELIASPYLIPLSLLLSSTHGQGLEVYGRIINKGDGVFFEVILGSKAKVPLEDIAIQFNRNSFGISPMRSFNITKPLAPGDSFKDSIPLSIEGPKLLMDPLPLLQIAVKTQFDIFYFDYMISTISLLKSSAKRENGQEFEKHWKELSFYSYKENIELYLSPLSKTIDRIIEKLKSYHFLLASHQGNSLKFVAELCTKHFVLVHLVLPSLGNTYKLDVRSSWNEIVPYFANDFINLLKYQHDL